MPRFVVPTILLSAMAVASASPASATAFDPARAPVAEPASKARPPVRRDPDQKICFRHSVTGSQIARLSCDTRGRWERRGQKMPAGV